MPCSGPAAAVHEPDQQTARKPFDHTTPQGIDDGVSQGRPLAGRRVTVGQEYRGPGGTFTTSANAGAIGADGTFLIRDLAPGDYKLRLLSSTNPRAATVEERVIVPISTSARCAH